MSWPVSWTCFYCSNPINRDGRHVFASIRHHYKGGATRDSDRLLHPVCFEKFEIQGGRPYNPDTEYEVLASEKIWPETGAGLNA